MQNGKALVGRITDIPTEGVFRYSMDVQFFINGQGFVGTHNLDAFFDPEDTIATIRTKMRNTIIAKGAELGIAITTTAVNTLQL